MAALPDEGRRLFERLYSVQRSIGHTEPPPEMESWVVERFGSVEAVREQTVVRVTNRFSLEGTIFNPLRGLRPVDGGADPETSDRLMREEVERTKGGPFCHPLTGLPAEPPFGRVFGTAATSGANVAMAEAHHGVLVFADHDPLAFDAERIRQLLELGREWAARAAESDPEAHCYLLAWNCLPRAGSSIIHGHAQALLGRGDHFPKVEQLRRAARAYRDAVGRRYHADLLAAHRAVGLAVERDGVGVAVSLTPVKDRELLVIGPPGIDEREPTFADTVGRSLVAFRDALGVRSFNLVLHRPPIGREDRDGWEELGPMVRMVDRGDPRVRPSDIGALELYAASVVAADPFAVADRLFSALG